MCLFTKQVITDANQLLSMSSVERRVRLYADIEDNIDVYLKKWEEGFRNSEIADLLEVNIAEEDIICYKQMILNMYGEIVTPYQMVEWDYRTFRESEPIGVDGVYYGVKDEMGFEIKKGIHAYTDADSAKDKCDEGWLYGIFVYKAIIPKGTRYVEGNANDIVAEKMYLTDELVYSLPSYAE